MYSLLSVDLRTIIRRLNVHTNQKVAILYHQGQPRRKEERRKIKAYHNRKPQKILAAELKQNIDLSDEVEVAIDDQASSTHSFRLCIFITHLK